MSLVPLRDNLPVDIFDSTDIQATGRLDENTKAAVPLNFSGNDGLLLVSTAHGTDDGADALSTSDVVFSNALLAVGIKSILIHNTLLGKRLLKITL